MEFLINEEGVLYDFRYNGVQGNIVIPHGAKVIGRRAFADCPGLFSVVIPDSVEEIDSQAFHNCPALYRVLIPDSVRIIGSYAFADCGNLHDVTIPESVTAIRPCAFNCRYDSREYHSLNPTDFRIWGKRGSEAERYAKTESFDFRENREEKNTLQIEGRDYNRSDLTPDHDGKTVLIRMDEEFEWGITAEGYPYECCYESNGTDCCYFKPIPWVDLYAKIDELILLFRSNGFPEWAAEYEKIRQLVKDRPKADPAQAAAAVSVEKMREADAYTIAKGTPSKELMRRAAQGVFDAYGDWDEKHVLIICGAGNNGGDGYALAEILHDHGVNAYVYRVGEARSEDGAYYCQRCIDKGIYVEDWADFWNFDIYVDCLLGTGFHGVPREPVAEVIREINSAREIYGRVVISVDINSGMNGDTGEAELAVVSNLTVSIGSVKKGLLQEGAREIIGQIVNADIGIEFPDDRGPQS